MRRGIYFIAEGATEVEFIEAIIRPYFIDRGIYDIRAFDMGGSINFDRYLNDVTTFLRSENDIVVTSLIDFFRLSNDFPGYIDAKKLNGNDRQIQFIEDAVERKVNSDRFVPYIQLHEFEGLLFTEMTGFTQIPGCNARALGELKAIIDAYANPELINDGPETAPSKRLIRIIPGYNKPLYGAYIALENGLNAIVTKCPRFRNWLNILETTVKT